MDTTSGIGRRRALARSEASPGYVEKRKQMVQAAALLFKEKGYEATTLTGIARAVGAERATLYYYIGGKEELLREAVGDASSRSLDLMNALLASPLSARDRVRAFIEQTLEGYSPQVFVFRQHGITYGPNQGGPWARRITEQIRQFESGVVSLLEAGVADGSFRDDLDVGLVSQALWSMLNGTHRWITPAGRTSAKEVADTFATVFLDGVAA